VLTKEATQKAYAIGVQQALVDSGLMKVAGLPGEAVESFMKSKPFHGVISKKGGRTIMGRGQMIPEFDAQGAVSALTGRDPALRSQAFQDLKPWIDKHPAVRFAKGSVGYTPETAAGTYRKHLALQEGTHPSNLSRDEVNEHTLRMLGLY
jgi:hypothetical protein